MSHTMKIWERIIDRRLRMIVEKYRDGQREIHCAFIGLEKAYERVPREEVWNCLSLKNVPQAYIKDVQEMCDHKTTQARCGSGVSEKFETKLGVQQGSALSPFLFAVVMDCLTDEVRRESLWDIMYADDVALCSDSRGEVEDRLEMWTGALERGGMKVSRKKTEYLNAGI